jgi:hypothetical protein
MQTGRVAGALGVGVGAGVGVGGESQRLQAAVHDDRIKVNKSSTKKETESHADLLARCSELAGASWSAVETRYRWGRPRWKTEGSCPAP